jgi:hypothetical protein
MFISLYNEITSQMRISNFIYSKSFMLLLFCIFLLSCAKQEKNNCGYDHTTDIYYKLSDEAKAHFPYSGNDSLVFVSNEGDTAVLIGQDKRNYDEITTSVNGMADCGSTPQYTYHNENISASFISNDPTIHKLSLVYCTENEQFDDKTNEIKVFVNDIALSKSNLEFINGNLSSKDSIILNGTYQSGTYLEIHGKRVLLNYTLGILKFTDTDTKIWVKIK